MIPLQTWKLAARPKTLPASVAPVLVGAALALHSGTVNWLAALACLLTALLLQIGANLANDYFDYFRGADAGERLGPLRVTQAGLVSPAQMRQAMVLVFGLALLPGAYLLAVGGWPVLAIGLTSILAALAYTGGPLPFGYYGLGDGFAFLFFGPVAVCGTQFVLSGNVTALGLGASLPMGWLVTAILVVNNLRDMDSDRRVNKRTLATRLGETATRWEYALLLGGAFAVPAILAAGGVARHGVWITFGALILVPRLLRTIFTQRGRPLNAALAGTGQLTLVYAILFSIGLIL
jgi:1,4-dihydroxy-2-naphthoate octaprenyltransferase